MSALRRRLSYANVVATLTLFIALGGTSYAVLHIGSADVVDNSLRSRDIRNGTLLGRDLRDRSIRARDIGLNALGGGVVKESSLGLVPRASNADRLDGVTAEELRTRCPGDSAETAGVCIETAERDPQGFLTALNICDNAGRALVTMAQLDPFVRSHGSLPQSEWTASVYRNPAAGATPVEQLEAVLLSGVADIGYDRVYAGAQHAFRCAALPSN